ncbi:MAG: hypothetical protein KDD56_02510 [Bdellovibrionales bacterium]|nr:hypothetical protein [Bdellovibrionales bacterium]
MNLPIFCSSILLVLTCLVTLCLAMLEAGAIPSITLIVGTYASLCILYLFIIWKFRAENSQSKILVLIAAAVAARIILCFAPPILNSDIWRYLWDGSLIANGINPYLHAPNEASFFAINTKNLFKIQNPGLNSIYSPYALYLFSILAISDFTWKLFIVACDIANILIILRILNILGKKAGNVLIYAVLPVALIESGASGRLEVVFILCFLSLIYFSIAKIDDNRWIKIGIFSSIGFLINPIFIIPLLLFLYKSNLFSKKEKFQISFLFVIICVLSYMPLIDSNWAYLKNLKNFTLSLHFNDGTIYLLDWATSTNFSMQQLKIMLLVSYSVFLIFIGKRQENWLKASILGLLLLALMNGTFYPSYLLWFAPILCLTNLPILIYLALILPVTYYFQIMNLNVPIYLKLAEFLPIWFFIVMGDRRNTREIAYSAE